MNYLLDTNACIALVKGVPASVRIRFQKAIDEGGRVFVSAVVAFELWYGVSKSSRPEANSKVLQAFLIDSIDRLAFDDEDARVAGGIRADLERAGRAIGAYDLLIAGQAMRHKLKLITANVSEFDRIKGLQWEDWAKA